MEDVLAIIESQANTAMKNLDDANAVYKEAINSKLVDELFKPATNKILLDMDQTRKVAEQVVVRVHVLRETTSNPNFLQELKVVNEMVVGALAGSEDAVEEMQMAVADSAQRRQEEVEIRSKVKNAWKILNSCRIAYEEATNSGLGDQVFYSVTKLILSNIEKIRQAAKHVFVSMQVMRSNTRASRNNRPGLDKMAGDVLTNSEAALGQMQKAIADAYERKNTINEKMKGEEVNKLEKEDKEMDAILGEINFKAWTAKMNVEYSHIACRKASVSGLADKVFKDVAIQIISDMNQTSITAQHVLNRLKALRDEKTSPNFYKNLNEVEEIAVDAMTNSEYYLGVMRKVVADAKQRKKAREEAAAAEEEEEARVEEVRKNARKCKN